MGLVQVKVFRLLAGIRPMSFCGILIFSPTFTIAMNSLNLLGHLETFYPLTDQFKEALRSSITNQKLKKGQVIYPNAGLPAVWYLKSGLAKGHYYDLDGKEHITRFWKQGETMLLAEITPNSALAASQITLLEDSTVTIIGEKNAVYLYNRFAEASKLLIKILLSDRNKAEIKAHLRTLPAAQAYQEFKNVFPAQRIVLKEISCYLEISQAWLSDIRKNRG